MSFVITAAIIIILVSVKPAYCYIDPSTGTMFFSIIISIVSVGFFAAKTIIHKMTTMTFWNRRGTNNMMRGRSKEFVIYSEGKQYWNLFKPIVEEFDKRKIKYYYYTSDEKDPCFEHKSDYIEASFIGKGNRAYAKLNILEADLCLMTTPGLDVYQLRRSKLVKHYSFIHHAPGDATLYRLFGLDYFDSILLTGDYQIEDLRKLESMRNIKKKEMIVVGCTYLDVLKIELSKITYTKTNENITVLVAPSWGESGLLKKYGMNLLNPLAKSNFNVIIRPHPQSSVTEKDLLERLTNDLKDYQNVEWDFERNNITAMSKSDILISDFSGIIFDYLFLLSRPVIYTSYNMDLRTYDAGDIEHELKQFIFLKDIGIKLPEENFADIKGIVENSVKNDTLKQKIEHARNEAYCFPGESGVRTVDALIDLRNRSLNSKA